MNPLTLLPDRVRLYLYVAFSVAMLAVSAYQAADGDLLQALGLLLGSLVGGTAATHTPRKGHARPARGEHRHEIHVHVNGVGSESAAEIGRQIREHLDADRARRGHAR